MAEVKEYNIDKSFAVLAKTDGLGSQPKFFKDNYWYKYNQVGNEGLAESMVSDLLECSNIKDFVSYEYCKINGKYGCRSKNFLKKGEQLITFEKICYNVYGESLSNKIRTFETAEGRFAFLTEFIKKETGLDCTRYLQNIFALDMLILNPDRHFNNLAIILKADGTFREAPIFDNGQGLLQNFSITPPLSTEEEIERNLVAGTISGSFEKQVQVSGSYLQIDYEKVMEKLSHYPKSIAKECLLKQLAKYEKDFALTKEKVQEKITLE